MNLCSTPDCPNYTENDRVDHCASCAAAKRKEERQASKPAKPQKPLKRTSVKKVSDKRREEMKDYATLRKQYLKENPICEANLRECEGNATEIHHKAKRGANYLNVKTFMAVCQKCHVLIEQKMSAEQRREQGFLMTVTEKPTI